MKYKENKMQKKYSVVFIVRKINDLDHMLPLICKFAKEGNFVRVMTLDVKKIDNYLTNYMYGKHNLKVETPVVNNINKISRFLVFIFDKFIILAENNRWHTLLKYLKFIYRYTKRRILSREDFKDSAIIDYDNTDIIIVDKTNVIKNKIYKNITKHASVNNIPIIRLQHGIDMRLTSIGDNSDLLVHDYGNKVFDIYYSIVETYNLSTGVKTTVGDLTDKLLLKWGDCDKKAVHKGNTPGDIFGIYLDNSKLKKDFKIDDFINLDDGLSRFIEWSKTTKVNKINEI